jgi:uncharacterized membrane protein YidH (DUF202 family)
VIAPQRPAGPGRPDPPARLRRRHLPGLPGERTLLAWDRTALALLGNLALLIIRHTGSAHPLRLAAAVLAGCLAAICGWLAVARGRAVSAQQRGAPMSPPTAAAVLLTAGVVAMAGLELAAILRA